MRLGPIIYFIFPLSTLILLSTPSNNNIILISDVAAHKIFGANNRATTKNHHENNKSSSVARSTSTSAKTRNKHVFKINNSKKKVLAADSDSPSDKPMWDVLELGVDLAKVKADYQAALSSGELVADGYTPVGCIPDRNLLTRDLHGNEEKFEGPISIIKYTDVVADQKAMTHEVCYEFCRRFKGVTFFGITNAKKCYCEPMFVEDTAGNASGCKTKCPGNPKQICGGPDASSLFEMHDAPPKKKFTDKVLVEFKELKDAIKSLGENTKICVDDLKKAGSALVSHASGNPVAAAHQEALGSSYQAILADANDLPVDPLKLSSTLEQALGEYAGLPADTKNAAEVETKMKAVELAAEEIKAALPEVKDIFQSCHPNITVDARETDLHTYMEISEAASGGQTCKGKIMTPITVVSGSHPEASCARKCSETLAPERCVGFQVYRGLMDTIETTQTGWQPFINEHQCGFCNGRVRFGADHFPWPFNWWYGGSERWAERDFSGHMCCSNHVFGDPCWGIQKRCECMEMKTSITLGGAACMLFSEISGAVLYSKPDCPKGGRHEAKCYVPGADIKAHELTIAEDTVSLGQCYSG